MRLLDCGVTQAALAAGAALVLASCAVRQQAEPAPSRAAVAAAAPVVAECSPPAAGKDSLAEAEAERDPLRPAVTELGSKPVEIALGPAASQDAGIDVVVNGQGPFHVGYDTGQSFALLVTRELTERLNLPVTGQISVGDGSGRNPAKVDRVHIESMALGSAVFRDFDALVFDLAGHGTVGFGLFAECLLTVDQRGGMMRLARGALPPPDGKTVLPLLMTPTPAIAVTVGSHRLEALIDSAWKGTLAVPEELAAILPLAGEPAVVREVATLFNRIEIRAAPLDGDLMIGSHRIARPVVELNAVLPEPILGGEILKDFTVTFDQRNLRVRFEN